MSLLVLGSVFIAGCPGNQGNPAAPAPVTIYKLDTPTFTYTQACWVGTSPTCTPTFTYTFTNTFTITNTPTNTFSPTDTLSQTPTLSPTNTLSTTPTPTGTLTPLFTATASPTSTFTINGAQPTFTFTPTQTSGCTPIATISVDNYSLSVNAYQAPDAAVGYCIGAVAVTIQVNHAGGTQIYTGNFDTTASPYASANSFSQTIPTLYAGDSWTASFDYLGQIYSQSVTFPTPSFGCEVYLWPPEDFVINFNYLPSCSSGVSCTAGSPSQPITITSSNLVMPIATQTAYTEDNGWCIKDNIPSDPTYSGNANDPSGASCDFYCCDANYFYVQCPITIGNVQVVIWPSSSNPSGSGLDQGLTIVDTCGNPTDVSIFLDNSTETIEGDYDSSNIGQTTWCFYYNNNNDCRASYQMFNNSSLNLQESGVFNGLTTVDPTGNPYMWEIENYAFPDSAWAVIITPQ